MALDWLREERPLSDSIRAEFDPTVGDVVCRVCRKPLEPDELMDWDELRKIYPHFPPYCSSCYKEEFRVAYP